MQFAAIGYVLIERLARAKIEEREIAAAKGRLIWPRSRYPSPRQMKGGGIGHDAA